MTLSTLELRERVALDRGPIEEMCQTLGAEQAERLVGGAIEELAVWISRAHPLWRRGDHAELGRLAQRIAPVAAQLGMPALARIAAEVRALSAGGDPVSLGAVTERLVRVGESSLIAIWDLQDLG